MLADPPSFAPNKASRDTNKQVNGKSEEPVVSNNVEENEQRKSCSKQCSN